MIEVRRVKTSDRGVKGNHGRTACYDVFWHDKHVARFSEKQDANAEASRITMIERRYQNLLKQPHPAAQAQAVGFASRYP